MFNIRWALPIDRNAVVEPVRGSNGNALQVVHGAAEWVPRPIGGTALASAPDMSCAISSMNRCAWAGSYECVLSMRSANGCIRLRTLFVCLIGLFGSVRPALSQCPGGGGSCWVANGTPGCDGVECCMAVCAIDPFCCDILWDSICADEASDLCAASTGDCLGYGGGCCVANETPGCDDVECCVAVCAIDQFCCDTSWDSLCADAAADLCAACARPMSGCPGGGGECCVANGTPGCDDVDCCEAVCAVSPNCCAVSPHCCGTTWTDSCAAKALELCPDYECSFDGERAEGCTTNFELAPMAPMASGVEFGRAVAISENIAVVGSCAFVDQAKWGCYCCSGGAYFYRFNGESWVGEYVYSNADAFTEIGYAVALRGETALVSEGGLFSYHGVTVHVFEYDGSGWFLKQDLIPTGLPDSGYGPALAIDGDNIMLGNPVDHGFDWSVDVFHHEESEWVWTQKLYPPDGTGDDAPQAIAMSGDVSLVTSTPYNQTGSAYVYRWDSIAWTMEASLVPFGGGSTGAIDFGFSAAVDGDVAVLGAPLDPTMGPDDGAVFVYRHDGIKWVPEQKLLPQRSVSTDTNFGRSVTVVDGIILVGAKDNAQFSEPNPGEIYVFEYVEDTGWILIGTLHPPSGAAYTYGAAVDASADRAIIGATGIGYVTPGKAYVLDPLPSFIIDAFDLNEDCAVDLLDFTMLWPCLVGPDVPVAPDCLPADFDDDGNVDLRDVARFFNAQAP